MGCDPSSPPLSNMCGEVASREGERVGRKRILAASARLRGSLGRGRHDTQLHSVPFSGRIVQPVLDLLVDVVRGLNEGLNQTSNKIEIN